MSQGLSKEAAKLMYRNRTEFIPEGAEHGVPTRTAYGHEGTSRADVSWDLFGNSISNDAQREYRRQYRDTLRAMRRNTGDYRYSSRNTNDGVLRQMALQKVLSGNNQLGMSRTYGNPSNSTAAYDIYTPEYKESLMNEGSYYNTDADYNPGIDTRMHISPDGTTLNFGDNGGIVKPGAYKIGGHLKKSNK